MSPQTKIQMNTLARMQRAEQAARESGCCSVESDAPSKSGRALVVATVIVCLAGIGLFLFLAFRGPIFSLSHFRLSGDRHLSATAQTYVCFSSLEQCPSLAAGQLSAGRLYGVGAFSGEA